MDKLNINDLKNFLFLNKYVSNTIIRSKFSSDFWRNIEDYSVIIVEDICKILGYTSMIERDMKGIPILSVNEIHWIARIASTETASTETEINDLIDEFLFFLKSNDSERQGSTDNYNYNTLPSLAKSILNYEIDLAKLGKSILNYENEDIQSVTVMLDHLKELLLFADEYIRINTNGSYASRSMILANVEHAKADRAKQAMQAMQPMQPKKVQNTKQVYGSWFGVLDEQRGGGKKSKKTKSKRRKTRRIKRRKRTKRRKH